MSQLDGTDRPYEFNLISTWHEQFPKYVGALIKLRSVLDEHLQPSDGGAGPPRASELDDQRDLIVVLVPICGSLVGLAFCLYWGIRAWRSGPDAWRASHQSQRPVSWQRWPIYSALWRDFDRHTARYLWLTRILAPVGAASFAVAIVLAAKLLSLSE